MNNPDWASKWALYSPEREAFKEYETGRVWTYGQINRAAKRLAFHLTRDRGLAKGDRIAVLAENCLEYILLFSAAQKTGLVLVPLNYRLATAEIDYLLGASTPKLIVCRAKVHSSARLCPCLRPHTASMAPGGIVRLVRYGCKGNRGLSQRDSRGGRPDFYPFHLRHDRFSEGRPVHPQDVVLE